MRHFNCQSGVVITASHNPKEYNGYKAYWDDGGQVVAPHDKNIIEEVNKITNVDDINFKGAKEKITILGKDFDSLYIDKLKSLSISPNIIKKHSNFSYGNFA